MENYEKQHLLGRGAYASVYKAVKKSTNEVVAMKKVKIGQLAESEKKKALDEVELLSKLKHPNIVQYLDSFEYNTDLYIIMEFVDGGDLSDKIFRANGKNFAEADILKILSQLVLALNYIHSKHIIHRDLKPQNVFLTKSGIVKLGDFGVARSLDSSFACAQTIVGTPYYLPPEIWAGQGYNAKADVYSLGCVIYEMAALDKPYAGDNTAQLYSNLMRQSYKPLPQQYSLQFRNLVDGMLNHSQMMRPSIRQILSLQMIKNAMENLAERHDNKLKRFLTPDLLRSSVSSIKNNTPPPNTQLSESTTKKGTEDFEPDFEDDFEDDFEQISDDEELAEATKVLRDQLDEDFEDEWSPDTEPQQTELENKQLTQSLRVSINDIREKLKADLGESRFLSVYKELENSGDCGPETESLLTENPASFMLIRRLIDLEKEYA